MRENSCEPRTCGRKVSENHPPEPLAVATGRWDDERVVLEPSHPLFAFAAHAREHQDTRSDAEHRSLWEALLPKWPHLGRIATVDRLAEVVDYARTVVQLENQEIAALLVVEVDTVRRRSYHERAAELAAANPLDAMLGSSHGQAAARARRGPWVYPTSEPTPAMVVPFDGPQANHPDVDAAWQRVRAHETAMREADELVWCGPLICRVVNGEPDVERALKGLRASLAPLADCEDEVEAVVADARASATWS